MFERVVRVFLSLDLAFLFAVQASLGLDGFSPRIERGFDFDQARIGVDFVDRVGRPRRPILAVVPN